MVTTRTTIEQLIGHDYTKLQILLLHYLGVKLITGGTQAGGVRESRAGEDIWAHAAVSKEGDGDNGCTESSCVLCCSPGIVVYCAARQV
jgi:hypothetical protein